MAQYKHLPIYKVTYELLEQITRVTKDFPRDYKYSLAVKLRDEVHANAWGERKRFASALRLRGRRVHRDLTRVIV